jgi:hypothetical protein
LDLTERGKQNSGENYIMKNFIICILRVTDIMKSRIMGWTESGAHIEEEINAGAVLLRQGRRPHGKPRCKTIII